MKKCIIIFWLIAFLFGAFPVSAAPDFPESYDYYMALGKKALEEGDYPEAIKKFRHAQLAGPHEAEPALYINLIKRMLDDRIEPKPATETLRPVIRSRKKSKRDGIILRRSFEDVSSKPRRSRVKKQKPAVYKITPPKPQPAKPEPVILEPIISKPVKPISKLKPKEIHKPKPEITSRDQIIDEALTHFADKVPPKQVVPKAKKTIPSRPALTPAPKISEPEPSDDIVISKSDFLAEQPSYDDYAMDEVEFSVPSPPLEEEYEYIPEEITLPPARLKVDPPPDIGTPKTVIQSKTPDYILAPLREPTGSTPRIVYLNDELWQDQPGTLIRFELRSSVILQTQNYKRHLIVTPDFIEVKQIDKDQIIITSLRRGPTILHVWDDRGRWTFNVEVILPIRKSLFEIAEDENQQSVDPFRLSYSADWSSFYRGQTYNRLNRENLNYLQRILLEGETPYGDFDGHVIFNKFDESTEVTGYGIGLTDGKIGNFEDFRIRGFDLRKTFSPLTMPGQYVRGVLFESKAFNKNLEYSYIFGRDRAIFGFLSPNASDDRESFVEGVRMTLFPESENQYSINFARGYGDAREPFLKDRVYSFEAQRRISEYLLSGEYAYDETDRALTAKLSRDWENHQVTVNLRNVEDDFTSITSSPGNQGEVGGSIFWNWQFNGIDIDTHLDLYRERLLPNPEAEDTLNVDYFTRVDIPVSSTDRLRASLYYIDTSGEVSPRNDIRTNTTYTKRFVLGSRDITAFIGATQQRSRFEQAAASEFDRFSVSSGFSIPIIKRLNFFTNYEYSWVYEEQSGEKLRPHVLRSGINYTKKLNDDWAINSSFTYRDEENTDGTNSFLAGEDSITGSIGASYRPNEDFEFFADGRTRNVWAESADRVAFNDLDIRLGIRTSWDVPFRWNPKGTITGYVYKDLNGNQVQDDDENGIADVTVNVGKQTAVTNDQGYYQTKVRAKSVNVGVEINTIPDGFIFTTPTVEKVLIIPHKVQEVNFGINAESGVFGIVYYDQNGSGKPDRGDEFISKVKIILDNEKHSTTDIDGNYSFGIISPGKHHISIDVNTLPIEYLPKIRIKNEIEVSEGATYVFHIPLEKVSQSK